MRFNERLALKHDLGLIFETATLKSPSIINLNRCFICYIIAKTKNTM